MRHISWFFKRLYRLTLSKASMEKLVWEELKKLHLSAKWHSGIFEEERYIDTIFNVEDAIGLEFRYLVKDHHFICDVVIAQNFPEEMTTDLFVMAAHFNNMVTIGSVIVWVDSKTVFYRIKADQITCLFRNEHVYLLLLAHFKRSKDVYWAFQKLIVEQEEPSVIMGELIRKNDQESAN